MSLAEFQRALTELTLDPVHAGEVRKCGAESLRAYALTPAEQTRLVSICKQPGMALNCTLARGNRFATILAAYPLTCTLLKPQLRQLLDELWHDYRPDNYQLSGEEEVFAGLLERKIAAGEIESPYAADVFRYETIAWELVQHLRTDYWNQTAADQPVRYATFRYDPRLLLPPLENDQLPPADLPEGEYRVKLLLSGDTLEVDLVA